MSTKIYTLFTASTPYEEEASKTVKAFFDLGIVCTPLAYNNLNDWMKNAMARAELLLAVAKQFPEFHIGVVDADNRPIKMPTKLIEFDADYGCEDRGTDKKSNIRYSAGIQVFGASQRGRKLLQDWTVNCKMDSNPAMPLREQHYLYQAICTARQDPEFRFENFGNAYNRKPEDVKMGDDTVMVHDVASRRFLKKIGGRR